MLFKKRVISDRDKSKKLLNYLLFRDSLTGLMNRAFAVKEYRRLNQLDSYGGVMVTIPGCDNMHLYKGEAYIRETGEVISRIYDGEIARIEYGDFLIFTDKYEETAEKLEYFLDRLYTSDKAYAVAYDKLDPVEDFDHFLSRIRRHIAAVELSNTRRRSNLTR